MNLKEAGAFVPELHLGSPVPIPCRGCGKKLLPFTVALGMHLLSCPICGKGTEVLVRRQRGRLRVWSRDQF
jgi:hypothetical protein